MEDYKTSPRPYEGHYIHSQVKLRPEQQALAFRKGDYVATLRPAGRALPRRNSGAPGHGFIL